MQTALLKQNPLLIAALHMPTRDVLQGPLSIAWLEDYVASNLEVFSKGGIQAVKIQDEFSTSPPTLPEVIALMASIGRLARKNFPDLDLGIIIEAHDPIAPLAIAHACGASFIRLKVFGGAMVKAEGIFQGCGAEAVAYRQRLGASGIAILADVHDRTGYPLSSEPVEYAAGWAEYHGADALVLTGHNYAQTKQYFQAVRGAGIKLPLIMGGGANAENIADVLTFADGVIVSSALKLAHAKPTDTVQWDLEKVQRFVERATSA